MAVFQLGKNQGELSSSILTDKQAEMDQMVNAFQVIGCRSTQGGVC